MLRPNKFQDGPISTDFSKFFDYMSYHRDIPISIVEETMCSWLILFYLLASKLPRPHYLQNYFGKDFCESRPRLGTSGRHGKPEPSTYRPTGEGSRVCGAVIVIEGRSLIHSQSGQSV